jgi:hypothetical protein
VIWTASSAVFTGLQSWAAYGTLHAAVALEKVYGIKCLLMIGSPIESDYHQTLLLMMCTRHQQECSMKARTS